MLLLLADLWNTAGFRRYSTLKHKTGSGLEISVFTMIFWTLCILDHLSDCRVTPLLCSRVIPVFTGMTLKERDCFVADGGSQWQERTHPVPSGHPSGQRGHFKVRELWSWGVNFRSLKFFELLNSELRNSGTWKSGRIYTTFFPFDESNRYMPPYPSFHEGRFCKCMFRVK